MCCNYQYAGLTFWLEVMDMSLFIVFLTVIWMKFALQKVVGECGHNIMDIIVYHLMFFRLTDFCGNDKVWIHCQV